MSDEQTLSIEIRDSIATISASEWNALNEDGNPFVTYEFLYSLEATGCFGTHNGWFPRYFLLWQSKNNVDDDLSSLEDDDKSLVGAMPAYLKTNSYGEFVFDWSWAEAYERHNLPYYPKLVCSIPFTPATGPRILVHPTLSLMMSRAAQQFCHSQDYSSVHWLFMKQRESELLCGKDNNTDNVNDSKESNSKPEYVKLLSRLDCQYHWRNQNYDSFDSFLATCTSKRRKTIRRERRHVTDAPLKLARRLGNTLSKQEWQWVHELYASTFDRKWGYPSLTNEFFNRIGKEFGGNVLVVLVHNEESPQPIACSIMFIGKTVLYGRYWGCREQHHSLHFEACYYQGIEYCIENGLESFEPGAQGEHKITRGFEPTITRSAHYIAHPGFREAIADFLSEERPHVIQRCDGLTNLLPYKQTALSID